MTEEQEQIKKRLLELAEKAYRQGVYTYTGFLSMEGLAVLAGLKTALAHVPWSAFGGVEGAERQVVRFGSSELCGYEAEFPIVCVEAAPASVKFSDALTHRDFLGALMNLGVKREVLGDILLWENAGYLFCLDSIAPFLAENLTRVRRTTVRCRILSEAPTAAAPALTDETVQVAGVRLDAMISRVYRLSREESAALFRLHKVFLNGVPTENSSAVPRENDIVSVRGYGRFRYYGVGGTSKKGKLNLRIGRYGSP